MAIPQLSPEDRQAALEKAKAARIKRARRSAMISRPASSRLHRWST